MVCIQQVDSLRPEPEWPVPEREGDGGSRIDLNSAAAWELSDRLDLDPRDGDRIARLRDSLGAFSDDRQLALLGRDLHRLLVERRGRFRIGRSPPVVAIRLRASLGAAPAASPWKTYLRAALAPMRTLRLGVLAEKDAGEAYRHAFVSGHLLLDRAGFIERLILGDFSVHAGQGLVLGRGGGFRREFPVHEAAGIAPHTYADETEYLRGAAATLAAGRLRLTLWYSGLRRSARVDADGDIAGLEETGLFRTARARAGKDAIAERSVGSTVTVTPFRSVTLGLAGYRTRYEPGLPGQGSVREGAGVHWRVFVGGTSVEGELAWTHPGGTALAACWILPAGGRPTVVAAVRSYAPGGVCASAPGRSGVNEQGASIRADLPMGLRASVDVFREILPTIRTPMARSGAEAIVGLSVRTASRSGWQLRWRWSGVSERDGVLDERGRESWRLADRQRHSLRCLFRHDGVRVSSASRLELTLRSGQRGWLLGQTLAVEPWRGIRLSVSVGLFRAPSYDARIVISEPDHAAPRFLVLSGSGVRAAFFGRLRAGGLGIGLKAATVLRRLPSSAGGRERTTELSFQLDGGW